MSLPRGEDAAGRSTGRMSAEFTGRTPAAFVIAGGVMTIVAACSVASWIFPQPEEGARLAVVALAVGGFAAAVRAVLSVVAVPGLAWVFFLGFLVDQQGELRWHGAVDLLRLGVLVGASLLGSAVGTPAGQRPDGAGGRGRENEKRGSVRYG
jgi:hypothetical protein